MLQTSGPHDLENWPWRTEHDGGESPTLLRLLRDLRVRCSMDGFSYENDVETKLKESIILLFSRFWSGVVIYALKQLKKYLPRNMSMDTSHYFNLFSIFHCAHANSKFTTSFYIWNIVRLPRSWESFQFIELTETSVSAQQELRVNPKPCAAVKIKKMLAKAEGSCCRDNF